MTKTIPVYDNLTRDNVNINIVDDFVLTNTSGEGTLKTIRYYDHINRQNVDIKTYDGEIAVIGE